MQRARDCVLKYFGVKHALHRAMYASSSANSNGDDISQRVLALVKRFDKIDANKVTETADFRKDLSLDSLDKVELVMSLEEEFSIEIPEDKPDSFNCCSDVANYISSVTESNS